MNWLVVRTKPNKEGIVKKLLSNNGIESLIPMEKIAKKDKIVSKKLMPGYIFVSIDKENPKTFNTLKSIEGILSFDYSQKLLTIAEIDSLIPDNERPVTELESIGAKKGDLLSITYGPMQGSTGTLEKIDTNKNEAVVKVEIFNRITHVTVGTEYLELAR